VVVGGFVLLVAATLIAKSRTAPVESVEPAASKADLNVKEVQIEEESGGVRWRLKAEQAAIFEQEDRTTLRKIAVDVYERDRSWTVVGDEGDLYQKAKRVEVRGNVVLTSNDGLRVETSVIRWNGADKRLWTDAPVVLSRQGSVVRGTALVVRTADETTTVAGPVHAIFAKAAVR
jgi:LPS export ABC transporter protein LptC